MKSSSVRAVVCVLLVTVASASWAQGSAEREVQAAMESWRQAVLKSDAAALERLFHPELTYGHSNGQIDTKAQLIDQVVKTKTEVADLSDTKTKVNGNLGLVHGKVHFKQVIDGKPNDVHLVVLHVWLKGSQGWQLIGRQATRQPPASSADFD